MTGPISGRTSGWVYFTDTRGYHTALNGGFDRRVDMVAALAYPPQID